MTTKSAQTRRLLEEMALEEAAIVARTKEAREATGLTQEEVADALETHVNTIRNWENEYPVPMRNINRLAAILKTTPEWILHGEHAPAEGTSERLDRMERMLEEVLRRLPPAESTR